MLMQYNKTENWLKKLYLDFQNQIFFFFKILFIFRQRGKEREREGEKHQCVVASHSASHWEPDLQPRHVP